MGLAAGQARLLTITARKSDCEFQSMRLSHEKIAMARDLADLSNKYQNSLDKTKLIYDYYGTGDTSNPLSYSTLMYPTTLNEYTPILLTDSMGRVVLDSKYAAAARKAGIPQEGLGTLPSEAMRNNFIQQLAGEGLITDKLSETIQGLPYSQSAGFGGGAYVDLKTDSGNITDLIEFIENNCNEFSCDGTKDKYSKKRKNAKGKEEDSFINVLNEKDLGKSALDGKGIDHLTLSDLLSDDESKQYYLAYEGIKGEQTPVYGLALMQSFLTDPNGFIDWLYEEFSSILDLGDGYSTGNALAYAYDKVTELVYPSGSEDLHEKWLTADDGKDTDEKTQHKNGDVSSFVDSMSNQWCGKCSKDEKYQEDCVRDSKYCMGFSSVNSGKGGGDDGNDHATAGINLNNIAKAFLTYFADYMNGITKKDVQGNEVFSVNKGGVKQARGDWEVADNHLATDNLTYEYTWVTGASVSSDDLLQAQFYDTLFNKICAEGWVENGSINDNTYLQEMLQSGKMYLTREKDDYYYYQTNYATDSYIKEVADESFIAQAEAKYNTEKAKLNAKEETLDMKMKNLDTEISSLTTEYDTVKNTISKNIEKSFKRYDA